MQHFSNYHYKDSEDDVFKIIEKPNKNSIYNEEEIDIILKCEEKSKFIAVEIKSYNSRKNT